VPARYDIVCRTCDLGLGLAVRYRDVCDRILSVAPALAAIWDRFPVYGSVTMRFVDLDASESDYAWFADHRGHELAVADDGGHVEPPRPLPVCGRPWEAVGWYDLTSDEEQHRAATEAIERFDALLSRGERTAADELLLQVDVSRLPHAVILAILNTTYPARAELVRRARFVEVSERVLALALGAGRAALLIEPRR
jgi:hypothetical protein